MKIKNNKLLMYEISEEYRNYLRKFDNKVSMKNERKFYGIIVSDSKTDYCIPFTSKVKSRNAKITINIFSERKHKVIAQLLLNNMIPLIPGSYKLVDISKEKYKDYINEELRYLRKKEVIEEILKKSNKLFRSINDPNNSDYEFFKDICCNFIMLKNKSIHYIENNKK